MGRKLLWPERMDAKLPEGTMARMDAVLRQDESRTDLVRVAVETEIKKREKRKLKSLKVELDPQ